MLLKNDYSVFVISLATSLDRRLHVTTQLNRLGVTFKFFDAVDGRNLADCDQALVANNTEILNFCGHEMTAGEVGCALSHIKLYQHIVDQGINNAVILEDDFFVDEHFSKILDALAVKAPSRAELIFLFHGKAKSYPLKRKLSGDYRLARYRFPSQKSKRKIISTVGYVITREGAEKLLKHAFPIRMAADYLTGTIQLTRVHAYGVEPCCLGHDVDVFSSTIEGRNYGCHIET